MSGVQAAIDGRVRMARRGTVGLLTLNRPEVINAFDLGMVRALRAAIEGWLTEDEMSAVVLNGTGDRGFCAGGDIRAVRDGAVNHPESVRTLWREEYELDALLGDLPIPAVALADGITMGGGMGLACHAAIRVVTERSRLAMPEVAIGLAPDAGGLHLLGTAPGELGTHLALTAGSAGPGDAIALGLADVAVHSDDLPGLVERAEHEDVHALLDELGLDRLPTPLVEGRDWVDECYTGDDVVSIRDRLAAHGSPDARAAASRLGAMAPTALAVTLDGLRRARRNDSLTDCLIDDLRRSSRFLEHPDLVEGIRAKIVDKDGAPQWQPASLEEVRDLDLSAFHAPLPDDLDLTGVPTAHC